MMGRPRRMEAGPAYALWAASYPAHAHNSLMRAEERAMLSLMPGGLRGQSVLDVGCGSGRYMLHVLRGGASRVTGVDLSPQMLQRAELELNCHHGNAEINLMQGELSAIPAPDSWADVTVCGLVVGHVADLQQALRELKRVTRP